jgi:hypothetical protein
LKAAAAHVGQGLYGGAVLVELMSGDAPEPWAALGFAVEERAVRIGPVTVRLDGAGGGLRGWTFTGSGPDAVDGIQTAWTDAGPAGPGAFGLDHVVVFTGDRDRTVDALVAVGGDERRRAGPPDVPVAMSFVRLGPVIVEVAQNSEPTRLWGLVAIVPDLDSLPSALVGDPRAAVQPGRQIVTARPQPGLETALAFMTPRVRTR